MESATETLNLVDEETKFQSVMRQIAGDTPLNIINVNGSEMVDRAKLFIIAEAKNSLNRIIKLTNFLEKLESKFIDAVSESLEENPSDIGLISASMDIISKLIADANGLITQILKDDRLQQIIINTTTVITPDGNSATVIDARSRDEIRNVASSLISQLSKIRDTKEVVEVEGVESDV